MRSAETMLDVAGVAVMPVAGAKAAASSSDSPFERGYERGEIGSAILLVVFGNFAWSTREALYLNFLYFRCTFM